MKTTVEIPNSLLEEAKRLASRQGTTIKALVIESLRRVLKDHQKKTRFHLRRVTFKGSGLQPPMVGASWEQVRSLIYEGRGG